MSFCLSQIHDRSYHDLGRINIYQPGVEKCVIYICQAWSLNAQLSSRSSKVKVGNEEASASARGKWVKKCLVVSDCFLHEFLYAGAQPKVVEHATAPEFRYSFRISLTLELWGNAGAGRSLSLSTQCLTSGAAFASMRYFLARRAHVCGGKAHGATFTFTIVNVLCAYRPEDATLSWGDGAMKS